MAAPDVGDQGPRQARVFVVVGAKTTAILACLGALTATFQQLELTGVRWLLLAGTVSLSPAVWPSQPDFLPDDPVAERVRKVVAIILVALTVLFAIIWSGTRPREAPVVRNAAIDAQLVASLIRRGPFTENLPQPYTAGKVGDVNVGDPSAVPSIEDVELEVLGPPEAPVFALLQVYDSPGAASRRLAEVRQTSEIRYGTEAFTLGSGETCFDLTTSVVCSGQRGITYAEVSIGSGSNADQAFAGSILSALLRYTDRVTALAAPPTTAKRE